VGIDEMTGAERWRVAGSTSPIANTGDAVIVADTHPSALDRSTGKPRWRSDVILQDESGVGVARAATAVSGDTVIVPAGPETIAIDGRSGSELWRTEAVHHPAASGSSAVGYITRGPATDVRVLDMTTGEARWTAPGAPSYGDLWAIGDDVVTVLDRAGGIVAYDVDTGDVRWRRDESVGQPHQTTGDSVINLWGGMLSVLSSADGSTRWSHEKPMGSDLMSSLAANPATVFVAVNTLPFGD
jgi:outer membrane protein assembly factor BamB